MITRSGTAASAAGTSSSHPGAPDATSTPAAAVAANPAGTGSHASPVRPGTSVSPGSRTAYGAGNRNSRSRNGSTAIVATRPAVAIVAQTSPARSSGRPAQQASTTAA